MKNNNLRNAQYLMLDILIEIDRICKKNNIPYWLDAGTLLGAVRHKGFIPWDDDIDICMLRADYFRFLDVCKYDLNSEYFCQTSDTDIEYPKRTIPCKIRKSKSYISEAEDVFYGTDKLDFHKGLYVDVFPMDYYGKSSFFRKKQRVFSVIYYLKTASIFINHKNLLRKILSKLFYYIPWSIIENIKNKLINKYNRVNDEIIGYGIEIPNCNYFHKKNNIFPLSTVLFEGFEFSAPKNTHEYLTILYGENYMELPPVDKRRSHTVSIEIYE
ncbi:LicD family protein [Photobacterium carnosum]|uniref:LicD family protein n=1 Tax=Photobacterium carnosum TaxID=2023717 RepID=UPI001C903022|nr:LicD family protein [Photobacterium carnosum]MBY3790484.1 LicD family protein [Photobacterium carnosum]MCD9535527.1 LicD family protein [Photobacterium carnosum]